MKCLNCGAELDDDSKFCINCGIEAGKVDYGKKRYTKAYLYFAIAILAVGIIGGIVAGEVFATRTGYIITRTEFNLGVMLYCWVATLLSDLFIFAIYSVCHRLDLLIDKK